MTATVSVRSMLIFDMDGTLLDSAPGIVHSLIYAMRQLGHDFHPDAGIQALFGPPMNQVVAQLLRPFGDDRITHCLEIYRAHYREQGLYDCSIYPGIRQALESLLASGFTLAVATSKRQEFADRMLLHTGLFGLFEQIQGTLADGSLDDKAELLRLLRPPTGQSHAPVYMIGDKSDDMLAAGENGIPAIGVTWGYGSADELTTSGALALAASPAQLPGLLRQLMGERKPPARQ